MMTGTYVRNLDNRHRLVLPPSLRRALPPDLYCLQASAGRLVLCADPAPYPVPRPHVYRVRVMDGAGGRWTVPQALRAHLGARIGDEVLLGGDGERVIVGRDAGQLVLALEWGEGR